MTKLMRLKNMNVSASKTDTLSKIENYCRYTKRYTPTTMEHILPRIKRILDMGYSHPTAADAIELEQRLNVGPSTLVHYLKALKLIAEYNGNPINVAMPKQTKKLRVVLSAEECRKLLNACLNPRDRCIVMLILTTGIRNKELRNLLPVDVDARSRVLFIKDRGAFVKSGEERQAILSRECLRMLQEWLSMRPECGCPYLFFSEEGKQLERQRLAVIVRNIAKRAGLNGITPHVLRHQCASMMLRSGVPLQEVALQLGHKNPMTTAAIYLHGDYRGLKDSIDRKFIF